VRAEEAEARLDRIEGIDVGVAHVEVRGGREERLDVREPVLEHREVRGDLQPSPQVLLVGDGPIRAAPTR